ncbi:hypothetical protein RDI58_000925 [Solanum bulbocastanum]|uniref:Uncharacterized protein n=1 Tax=Solanum bulbocastanum TaxID=147425 RepID=A0AAN8UBT8_SOLBU
MHDLQNPANKERNCNDKLKTKFAGKDKVEFLVGGEIVGVTSEGENVKCRKVICDPSYLSCKGYVGFNNKRPGSHCCYRLCSQDLGIGHQR